jgi:hypothetical protein
MPAMFTTAGRRSGPANAHLSYVFGEYVFCRFPGRRRPACSGHPSSSWPIRLRRRSQAPGCAGRDGSGADRLGACGQVAGRAERPVRSRCADAAARLDPAAGSASSGTADLRPPRGWRGRSRLEIPDPGDPRHQLETQDMGLRFSRWVARKTSQSVRCCALATEPPRNRRTPCAVPVLVFICRPAGVHPAWFAGCQDYRGGSPQ